MSSPSTVENHLKQLTKFGQSIWLDYIRRDLITSGELKRMVEQDGLGGMTSNPAIFEKAFSSSPDYASALADYQKRNLPAKEIYELLAIRDIQDVAAILRPVYESTKRRDGYVSLEVSPFLANNTQGTIEEARRLWKTVDRENVMIKVPGTVAGIPAIETLIGDGININVTLLFSQDVYEQVALAFLRGLEALGKKTNDLGHMASVASFFVSRIDTLVDSQIDAKMATATGTDRDLLNSLHGRVAIANAKLAYERYKRLFSGARWDALAAKGAQTQRVLWASTSMKNPKLRDVLYVEELVGRDTVNTIPPATLDAFRDHGQGRNALEEGLDDARKVMADLAKSGISIDAATATLVVQGVKLFSEAFDKLLNAVDVTCKRPVGAVNAMTYSVPPDAAKAIAATVEDWGVSGKVRSLWAGDAALWSGTDEGKWLGWLNIVDVQLAQKAQFTEFAADVKAAGFKHVALLGMGGSSLCPEVMRLSFGKIDGFPELHVLDSTDPAQIRALEKAIDIGKTLFIVSSKSGSTLEPNIYKQYFFERAGNNGSQFVAITDPGSKMQQVAERDKFRKIFFGVPSIGGRYSALSDFGIAPAAAMGIDTTKFLESTQAMVLACSTCPTVDKNPGALLGIVLGTLAKGVDGKKRDKVTVVASPGIHDLGAWLEQLLAESTGKEGKGLIPVDREALGAPGVYGNDRVFVYQRLDSGADPAQDRAVDALAAAGHPVIRISVSDAYSLGQEFFRWEMATAVAGSILGINAFNQPDVEASKDATRKLTTAYEALGALPVETPAFEDAGIKVYGAAKGKTLVECLRAHLGSLQPGDYFALLAYVQMDDANEAALQTMRTGVRDHKKVATCLGFGPRFLHSTGQDYKGGPNTGVFLQITADDAEDLAVPGQKYTFGIVKAAQARGDLAVLLERGRRALRVHLGPDVQSGLAKLGSAIEHALT